MKKLIFSLIVLTLGTVARGQDVKTSVKGMITDFATGSPVQDVNVQIVRASDNFSGQTNEAGKFTIETGVGRYKLTASSTGYESITQEILTIAGKDLTLNISLRQSVQQLEEVEVQSSAVQSELAGQRSLTIEKTLRIPANFFDPVRVVTSYPGVVTTNDQGNSIIVRGNSPNGLLWKLNGADIVNPNHLSNAGTFSDKPMANGGGVNILSAQMLDRTNFYMGQIPTAFGNALAGVIDMNLREGNKQKLEMTAQASLIGLDLAAEGPIGQKGNTSFLANYRYSTVGLLSAAGIDFGGEAISFQDLSFHFNHRSDKGVVASIFGFAGLSKNEFDAKDPAEWKEEKDQNNIDYDANTGAIGANVMIPIGRGKITGAVAYSLTDQSRNSATSQDAYVLQYDLRTEKYEQMNSLLSSRVTFETEISEKIFWSLGLAASFIDQEFDDLTHVEFYGYPVNYDDRLQGNNSGVLFQPHTNFHFNLSSRLSADLGFRYVNYSFNSTDAVEPRASVEFKPTGASSFQLGYSLVSQQQLPQLYAVTKELELTKSHHGDLSYSTLISDNLKLTAGVFYQQLFDVPISQVYGFSAINFLEGKPAMNLVSEGAGKNYGADLTLEKQFFNNHDVLLGGSYYKSTYELADGVERNSRFDGSYTFSAVHGKEWTKSTKNRTISLNTRLLYLGGMRQSAISETASQIAGETVYDPSRPYSEKLNDYFRLDLRLSFRKNKPKYTRTFALDIQNVTNQQNEAYLYYDKIQAKTVTKYQLGIIPVLVYRIDF